MRRSRAVLSAVAALGVASISLATVPTAMAAPSQAGNYIVQLDPSVSEDPAAIAAEEATRTGGTVVSVFRHAFKGYTINLPAGRLASVQQDDRVISVDADAEVHAFAQTVPTGVKRIFADQNPNLKINGQDDYKADVDVAVVDTGIDATHPDLNVAGVADCVSGTCTDGAGKDGNGHGTHVAGTIGAKDDGEGVVGVAPGARVWGVKVLSDSGSGSLNGVAAGIDWVVKNADKIEVINLSLGCNGCTSTAISDALTKATDKGIVSAIAAGNSNADAKNFFPANHPDAVTVSALADFNGAAGGGAASTCRADEDDTLANFSNFGATVEINAPGTCILSTWPGGKYNTISGTSMASPHVAGAAALLASGKHKPTSREAAEALKATLLKSGNANWSDTSSDGVKEPLLDVHDAQVYPPSDSTRS